MGVTRRDFVAGCGGAAVAGLTMSEAHAQSAPPRVESLNAPLHPGAPTLIVRDLAGVARYYEEGIGLARIDADSDTARLGAGGEVLIVLRKRPSAEREPPGLAGLYHTAFLVPGRADLGAWLRRAIEMKLPFDGAADHLVSESLYLSDPEGNGIEMYADRPRSGWKWSGDIVEMRNSELDIRGILSDGAALAASPRVPDGTRVGHVHLRVGGIRCSRRAHARGRRQAQGGRDRRRRSLGQLCRAVQGLKGFPAVTWHSSEHPPPQNRTCPPSWFLAFCEPAQSQSSF
jgi:catechol 2,3-dioxygenase